MCQTTITTSRILAANTNVSPLQHRHHHHFVLTRRRRFHSPSAPSIPYPPSNSPSDFPIIESELQTMYVLLCNFVAKNAYGLISARPEGAVCMHSLVSMFVFRRSLSSPFRSSVGVGLNAKLQLLGQRRSFGYEDTMDFEIRGSKPKCMVIHPVLQNRSFAESLYQAEEALNLARAAKLDIVPGPTEPNGGWDEDEFLRAETMKKHRAAAKERYRSSDVVVDRFDDNSDEEYDLDDEVFRAQRLREQVAESCMVPIYNVAPNTYFGEGKMVELVEKYARLPTHFVFINAQLAPSQTRNIEIALETALATYHRENHYQKKKKRAYAGDDQNFLEAGQLNEEEMQDMIDQRKAEERDTPKKVEVFDRYRMVLEVMSQRAKSALAKSQVAIAKLLYMQKRVHLYSPARVQFVLGLAKESTNTIEQTRGWAENTAMSWQHNDTESFQEYQIRIIGEQMRAHRDRVARIKKENEKRRNNKNNRVGGAPAKVALVGYTNAGKTLLMRRLVGESRATGILKSRDVMFETMDVTSKEIRLPSGATVNLADSMGFVSDIPPQLYEAFQATLDESLDADVLIHVRDMSHPLAEAHKSTVLECLHDAGVSLERLEGAVIEAWNKMDKLTPEVRADMEDLIRPSAEEEEGVAESADRNAVAISALEGDGIEDLMRAVEYKLNEMRGREVVTFKCRAGKPFADRMEFIRINAALMDESLESSPCGKYIIFDAVIEDAHIRRYLSRFGDEIVEDREALEEEWMAA